MTEWCSECGDFDEDSWAIPPSDVPRATPSIFWVNEDDEQVNAPPHHDPIDHPELTKKVFYECPECSHTWEKTIE